MINAMFFAAILFGSIGFVIGHQVGMRDGWRQAVRWWDESEP